MTNQEKVILSSIVEDIQASDDKIDGLECLYHNVKKLLKIVQL